MKRHRDHIITITNRTPGGGMDAATQYIQNAAHDFMGGATNDPSVYANGGPHVGEHADHPTSFFGQMGQTLGDLGRGLSQEGLGGVLDPAGMMDRQAAQRELRSRFNIVPDNFVGPRLPNQLTEAEFEQQAHTFSDIRMNRSDIHFDASTNQAYRDGAMGDMANLMQTPAGRQLLGTLSNNTAGERDAAGNPVHHSTTLRPYLDASGHPDTTNSDEMPVDASGNNVMGTPSGDARTTNGTGNNTVVRYNPGVNVQPPGATDAWWPARSDVIMMHEMTHAYTDTQGTTDNTPVQTTDGPGSTQSQPMRYEHQAAGLGLYANSPVSENAYRDQRALLGAAGGPGVQPGDVGMAHRDFY
jgi:NleD-like pathogen effector protein (putative zinc metallopeptidase)